MIAVIQHQDIEGPGTIKDFFEQTKWKLNIFNLERREGLPDIRTLEGLAIMGGSMNVYEEDKHPFLREEKELIRTAIDSKIPLLGICLGAQLIAEVLNARVAKGTEDEIGWGRVMCTDPADSLFKGLGDTLTVFQWHNHTFEVPESARLIAIGDKYVNQGFGIGEYCWGLQFHPEMNEELIISWLDNSPVSIDKAQIYEGYLQNKDIYHQQAYFIYLNFARIIQALSTARV